MFPFCTIQASNPTGTIKELLSDYFGISAQNQDHQWKYFEWEGKFTTFCRFFTACHPSTRGEEPRRWF